jgi:ABC-type Zn uptake system ZnuABC Zn-binding protein ZnuA
MGRRIRAIALALALCSIGLATDAGAAAAGEGGKIAVVTTLPDYAFIAAYLGGEHVTVRAICEGDQDAHFVRPKPSFAVWLSEADLFVTTGLDLELWAPSLIDKSGNPAIREGQMGYVAAADGLALLEIPAVIDRSQGGVHVYGNPHIHTSPLLMKRVARNIAVGLVKVDPTRRDHYEARLKAFEAEVDERLFGPELVALLGSATLTRLAESGNLVPFLEKKQYKGRPMVDLLGGWLGKARPLRGRKLVTYHKNWIYFTALFGLEVLGEVEPKPSIPPSPRDVERLVELMKEQGVRVVLAANYFDEHKVRRVTAAVGGVPVIVPMSVGGEPGVDDYFQLVDLWLQRLLDAFSRS